MPRFYKNYQSTWGLAGDIKPSKLFLAEGDSEAFFLESLFTAREFDESEYCVFCIKGIKNLGVKLHFLSTEPNFHFIKSLGIMVDANGDAADGNETRVPMEMAATTFFRTDGGEAHATLQETHLTEEVPGAPRSQYRLLFFLVE